ncbi:alpha/beta hydrolase [Niveispirillum sp. KHB5.9]|uniref:alpha/beta hydrolase n=1 Tax=Niveispirillum sp. KHB5.9 TaxID=3400269 RepID=UPI003A837A58
MSDDIKAAADLAPEIQRFHEAINGGYAAYPPHPGQTLADRRQVAEKVRAPWTKGGPVMARTREMCIGQRNVRVRIHEPVLGADLPVLIYIHGGGWMLFSLDTHDRLMREYAARAGVAVVGIDYSLSPEAKFPTALEEIVSVIDALRAGEAGEGLDATRLAIAGDSVGGNMSVATNLLLKCQGKPVLNAMLMNYGAFDHAVTSSHERYGSDGYMLNSAEMVVFWDAYLRGPDDYRDPLAAPLRADLSGLPPAFLAIAACDILVDENLAMADALRAAGVAVVANLYEGASHSFLEAVSISPLADRALTEAAAWLAAKIGSRT